MLSDRLTVLIENLDEAKRGLFLKSGQRRKINNGLYDLTTPKGYQRYFKGIPLKEIFAVLKKNGVVPIDESEMTKWSGFMTGRKGRATLALAPKGTADKKGFYPEVYSNAMLLVSWYKMDKSGKMEVVVYVN
jgi:hypothetical protein